MDEGLDLDVQDPHRHVREQGAKRTLPAKPRTNGTQALIARPPSYRSASTGASLAAAAAGARPATRPVTAAVTRPMRMKPSFTCAGKIWFTARATSAPATTPPAPPRVARSDDSIRNCRLM